MDMTGVNHISRIATNCSEDIFSILGTLWRGGILLTGSADAILAICFENNLVPQSLGEMIRITLSDSGQGRNRLISMIVSTTRARNDWPRRGVDEGFNGTNFAGDLEEIRRTIDIDPKVLWGMLMVNVGVRRSRINHNVWFDLGEHVTNMLDVGDIPDVVSYTFKAILKRRSAHYGDRCASRISEEVLHHVMAEKATAADDEASAELCAIC